MRQVTKGATRCDSSRNGGAVQVRPVEAKSGASTEVRRGIERSGTVSYGRAGIASFRPACPRRQVVAVHMHSRAGSARTGAFAQGLARIG